MRDIHFSPPTVQTPHHMGGRGSGQLMGNVDLGRGDGCGQNRKPRSVGDGRWEIGWEEVGGGRKWVRPINIIKVKVHTPPCRGWLTYYYIVSIHGLISWIDILH